jgi:hypothetical protein
MARDLVGTAETYARIVNREAGERVRIAQRAGNPVVWRDTVSVRHSAAAANNPGGTA